MKKNKIVLLGLLLSFCLIGIAQQKPKANNTAVKPQAASQLPQIAFEYLKYDFGNINERGGRVKHPFKFTNTGKSPLVIKNVITQCGCTSTEWPREAIPPGGTGTIFATYDPLGRQGAFDKDITLETNADPAFRVLRVSGYVIPNKNSVGDMYKYQYGNIAVNTNTLSFGKVPDSRYDSSFIGIFNIGNKNFDIYKIEAPNNIQVKKYTSSIVPYSDMTLYVNFYPKKPVEYGPIRQEIKLYTNDDTLKVKSFYVNAEVVEDFSQLDAKGKKRAPKLNLSSTELDFGNVSLFTSPEQEIKVSNKGKNDLIIRRIVRTCTCIIPTIDKMTIKKGETATLKVKWDLTNMAGSDERTFRLITNDPNNSDVEFKAKINVVP